MRAVVVEKYGSVEDLEVRNLDMPVPGANEVLVKVACAGVNYPDVLITKGLYQFKPDTPFSPGGEVSGEVVEVGDDVRKFKVGDRVIAASGWGGFSEFVAYNEDNCFVIGDNIDFRDAAVLLETYATAYHALVDRANLQKGERIAILGASGGTGVAAIQLSKVLGAEVVALASSEDKLNFCKENGADHLINYSNTDLKSTLKQLGGVDVIFDPVGGTNAEAAFRALNPMGRHLVIGFTSGEIPELPWNLPLLKSASIVGVFWGGFWRNFPDRNRNNVEKLLGLLEQGKIIPQVTRTFSPEESAEALSFLESRQVFGKVVIEF